jgi:hypothetical protein
MPGVGTPPARMSGAGVMPRPDARVAAVILPRRLIIPGAPVGMEGRPWATAAGRADTEVMPPPMRGISAGLAAPAEASTAIRRALTGDAVASGAP